MKISAQYAYEFYGQISIVFLTDENSLIVPLEPMCEILGLSSRAEARRIKHDAALCDALITVWSTALCSDASSHKRKTACILINRMPFWLITVDTISVRPELRDKFIRYKKEAALSIWTIYRNEVLSPDVLNKLNIHPANS